MMVFMPPDDSEDAAADGFADAGIIQPVRWAGWAHHAWAGWARLGFGWDHQPWSSMQVVEKMRNHGQDAH